MFLCIMIVILFMCVCVFLSLCVCVCVCVCLYKLHALYACLVKKRLKNIEFGH